MTETTTGKEEKELKRENAYNKFIDSFAGKIYSRKLTVWAIATIAFFLGKIDLETWKYITMVYIGAQGAIDLIQGSNK
ncbi:MAG: hypothetical protein N3A54_02565 [Patescibacteria group bacterium]|nr:hypothetical protein [Patescibacteria group bacterium]